MRCVIGVDPGVNGGIAVKMDGRLVETISVKSMSEAQMLSYVDGLTRGADVTKVLAVLEQPPTFIPGRPQLASRIGKMMETVGWWRGILMALATPLVLVRPQTWQKGIVKTAADNKAAWIAEAQRRHPAFLASFNKGQLAAVCDAVLIADFGETLL